MTYAHLKTACPYWLRGHVTCLGMGFWEQRARSRWVLRPLRPCSLCQLVRVDCLLRQWGCDLSGSGRLAPCSKHIVTACGDLRLLGQIVGQTSHAVTPTSDRADDILHICILKNVHQVINSDLPHLLWSQSTAGIQ